MRVLDIDLDFFLNKIAFWKKGNKRLDEKEYIAWKKDKFSEFLEKNCNLSRNNKIKGRIVKKHHEAFYFWNELIEKNQLDVPFEVIHIDAHADLGFGDFSYRYIMEELLHNPLEKRNSPEMIYEGNYLSFAIANRWINELTYVNHPKGGNDLLDFHFKDYDLKSGIIQLKKIEKNVKTDKNINHDIKNKIILDLEPEVPFKMVLGKDYFEKGTFDFAVFSISPKYTPKTIDRLIPIVKEYIEEI
ncbi:conserved hypothetical protein [Methanococcus vannielii SB]|uniref:Uncharacterized protein n=1 Tax=Methanococcus vannielii (strain ATCC 35089 / DSM 1224 / JCM 13029 / OCM 148 / SB) TaxID=406327 RepID=A6UPR5_METVS|nr:UPF0489 family protein [Methanococcus vannielii]ABR54487.1 conserved hypothetical protein [Methanococcus vannielii SB]